MAKNQNIIGQVIRKYRNYHGYSRRELAELLDMNQGVFYDYEIGRSVPPLDKLKKLHKILSIPFLEFFSDIMPIKGYEAEALERIQKYDSIIKIIESNPELNELIQFYGRHNDELKKDRAVQLIRKILKVPKSKRKSKYAIISKILSVE